MFARSCKGFFIASALALFPAMASALPSIAPPKTDFVRLYTLEPTGFGGGMAVTESRIGKVLHTADGGQVFGFDVAQGGTDGLLAEAHDIPSGVAASVETFDQTTAKITKTVAMTHSMDDFVVFGISAGDVGLVEHEHVVNNQVHRTWHLLDPVTRGSFNGRWTPPHPGDFLLQQVAENQATQTTAIFGIDFTGRPMVFSSNIAANTFGPVFHIDGGEFGLGDGPQLAVDTVHGRAVIATSPDGGAVGGHVPVIAMIDLTTGAMTQFNGVSIPPFFSGYVNGFAVDSATGIACTTTELDANVEFYDLSDGSGFNVGLPGAGNNQGLAGEAVVSDPIHKLFLVVQPNGSVGPPGDSVIDVFNEKGRLVKSITGFKAWSVTPGIAINPQARMGFIMGPTPDALTQFKY
jgi:hypothetical protein